jgi:hypothetical protein
MHGAAWAIGGRAEQKYSAFGAELPILLQLRKGEDVRVFADETTANVLDPGRGVLQVDGYAATACSPRRAQ